MVYILSPVIQNNYKVYGNSRIKNLEVLTRKKPQISGNETQKRLPED